jgi:CheY-like chemotaxis protein
MQRHGLFAGQQPVILVVDDDRDLRESLCEVLCEEGFSAAGVADGQEALEYLRGAERLPRLVFLDLMMPRMNGWQFRDAQKRDPRLAGIPVAVITAMGSEATLRTIDADQIIRKPPGIDELLETCRRYTG